MNAFHKGALEHYWFAHQFLLALTGILLKNPHISHIDYADVLKHATDRVNDDLRAYSKQVDGPSDITKPLFSKFLGHIMREPVDAASEYIHWFIDGDEKPGWMEE